MPTQCSLPRPWAALLGLLALLPPQVGARQALRESSSVGPHSYALHGEDWTDGSCSSRDLQSPVNFDDHILDPPMRDLKYHYDVIAERNLTMTATDGILHVDMYDDMVGGVVHGGKWHPLVRIDFHAAAEHTLKGVRQPLEIQLVHRQVDDPGKFVIVSVLVWCEHSPEPNTKPPKRYRPPDPAEIDFNVNLQAFLWKEPPSVDLGTSVVELTGQRTLDLSMLVENRLVEGSGTYIRYSGSTTQPPCREKATWYVKRTTVIAGDGQVKALADAITRLTQGQGNYRALMPFNARKVEVFKAVFSPEMGATPMPPLPLGPNPRTDDEKRAEIDIRKAQRLTNEANAYAEDFIHRLHAAADAHADTFRGTFAPTTTPQPTPGASDGFVKTIGDMRSSIYGAAAGVKTAVRHMIRAKAMEIDNEAVAQAAAAMSMTQPTIAPPGPAPAPAPASGQGPAPAAGVLLLRG